MGEAEYEEKREPNQGSRTTLRHGAQGAASAGGLAVLLQALVDAGKIDIQQAFVALAILAPIATTAWKAWDSLGFTARLRAWLDKRFPTATIIAALLIPMVGGCAIHLGTMEPKQFSTLGGGTLIACNVKGISIAIGDADLCSNSARGGHVSRTFAGMTLGIIKTAGAAVAGFFGGAGQGMAQAMQAAPEPEAYLPDAAPSAPVPVAPSGEAQADTKTYTTDPVYLENPFMSPPK